MLNHAHSIAVFDIGLAARTHGDDEVCERHERRSGASGYMGIWLNVLGGGAWCGSATINRATPRVAGRSACCCSSADCLQLIVVAWSLAGAAPRASQALALCARSVIADANCCGAIVKCAEAECGNGVSDINSDTLPCMSSWRGLFFLQYCDCCVAHAYTSLCCGCEVDRGGAPPANAPNYPAF